MKTPMLNHGMVAPILAELGKRHQAVVKLEIFGSVAAGQATEHSDLDVLVTFARDFPRNSRYVDLFVQLIKEMQASIGRKVDLIDRRALRKNLFSHNAVRNLRTVYERS
jgi:predicted nucleotidyltransferase